MLEQVVTIFDGMQAMMRKLKKASYETNMKEFRRRHGHYFIEMTEYVENRDNKEEAVQEVSHRFVKAVEEKFTVKGRIKGTVQADLNFFMIYYVFPAILLTESKQAKLLADTLCNTWGNTFKGSKIGYTDYDTLYKSFREKIFGII